MALAGPGGFRLYRGDGELGFTDVTAATGIADALRARSYQGVWAFDGDLEGDLDILLAAADGPPLVLRNNGDGTFEPIDYFPEPVGVRSFSWADLDEDLDPDAAFVDGTGRLHVYLNDRGGEFRHITPEAVTGASAIIAADLDADGGFELLAVGQDGSVTDVLAGSAVLPAAAEIGANPRLLVADADNNGALDLIRVGDAGSVVHLGDAEGIGGDFHVTLLERVEDISDVNGDGRLDLLSIHDDGTRLLQNEAQLPYGWQVLRPRAAQALGDQRINSFGIGGQIEARSGLYFQKHVIAAPQVHFGIGTRPGIDVARVIWPNGDIQAEFDLAPNQALMTQQRLKGSCPWVFVFDGEKMAFVTDFIWRSPLGLAINGQQQGAVVLTADRIKIPGEQLVAREGMYDVRVTAELWETHFFDTISLMAIDHPEGTEMFVDERFSIPAPDLTPRIMGPVTSVAAARDHNGEDVTDLVTERDARYLGSFERGRYQGVAEDHYVEFELGPDVPAGTAVWLVAQGWIYPTDSSINVALGQGSHAPPSGLQLEALSSDGTWQVVMPNLGFPAGKKKTILIPIGDVLAQYPAGRLRLRTNLEIFWDRLGWAPDRSDADVKVVELDANVADLRYRGYSEVTVADDNSPEIPHYDRFQTATRQWFDLEGYYTRFGDVRELLKQVDDRYVIMNAGDEIVLAFEELPPPAEGYVRDFLLVGDGWVKDGDLNTTHSRTVRPLPYHEDTAYDRPLLPLEEDAGYLLNPDDWQEYHTRYVAPDGFAGALVP